MEKPLDPLCPSIQVVLDLLGRPWTGLVLAALQTGPLRFSELSARLTDIGDKILSARLKDLEARGLVVREVDPGPPIRVTYALTSMGEGFRNVIEAVEVWGRQFVARDAAARASRGAKPREPGRPARGKVAR
ncbi:MAG: helix-turn-helix domain-containing protein [Myxococcaceae bacterium]